MLADLQLKPKLEKVTERLEHGSVLVSGPTGSGRSTIAAELARVLKVVQVEPPALGEVDAPLHVLAQSALDVSGVSIAFDETLSLFSRAQQLGRVIKEKGNVLVVRAPGSWSFRSGGDTADLQRRKTEVLQVVKGWLSTANVVLLTTPPSEGDALSQLFADDQAVMLTRVGVNLAALEDDATWADYSSAARALKKELLRSGASLTPLQVRLAVGLTALGDAPRDIVRELSEAPSRSTLTPLIDRLRRRLLRERPQLWAALQAVALARFPLPVDEVKQMGRAGSAVAATPDATTLLTQCIGYGDSSIRIPEPLRVELVRRESGTESAHARLASHYQSRDGAVSPLQLTSEPLRAWLEKAHHLAHTDVIPTAESKSQRWEDLEHPSKHLLWDRARWLSKDRHRYADSAELYRRSIENYGDDDYAWHYLGFNLHRAGKSLGEAERAYQQAVIPEWASRSPNAGASNPWWNSRLVTFLISQGNTRGALEAWGTAIDAIDPDRKRIGEGSWLAMHLHRWVTREWLDHGEVQHARAVFDEIPSEVVEREEELKILQWRLQDAEEAVDLVESVYPASTPPSSRWTAPQVPPGEGLLSWSPGRVVSANKHAVVVMIATVRDGKPQKQVVESSFTAKQWVAAHGWCPPSEAKGFIELHVTTKGKQRIVPVTAALPPWALGGVAT